MSSTEASSERSPRLFVAFDVPDDIRSLVEQALRPIRDRFPRARWVPVENQHVTVRFLGATPPDRVSLVVAALGGTAARHGPFSTRTTRLGAFPSARRARVLWVGLDDTDGRAKAIAADLDAALAPAFEPETRPFTPHLTVARFDPPVGLDAVTDEIAVESRPFDVGALRLYRSHLGRGAPRYEPLASEPLGGEVEGR